MTVHVQRSLTIIASGADSSDFVDCVNRYYSPSGGESEKNSADNKSDESFAKPHSVDRQLHQQAWVWLVQQPEVRVGKNGEGNELSLSEVEAFNKKHKPQEDSSDRALTTAPQASDGAALDTSTVEPSLTQSPPPTPANVRNTKRVPSQKDTAINASDSRSGFRIYTSEARMWQALTGHGPDLKRIPHMQFVCLSIIASRRTQGILQSRLVEISGQDKRSVPHRTDLLAENGYIEKKTVLSRGTKTSMLFAKRFAPKTIAIPQDSIAGQRSADEDQKRGAEIIDYRPVFETLLNALKEPKIMTLIDLKKKLVVTLYEGLTS